MGICALLRVSCLYSYRMALFMLGPLLWSTLMGALKEKSTSLEHALMLINYRSPFKRPNMA